MEKLVQVLKEHKLKLIIGIVLLSIATVLVLKVVEYNHKKYEVEEISEYNYYKLNIEDKIGIIDLNGDTIIEPNYEDIVIPNPQKPIFICKTQEKNIVLNDKNEQIFTDYTNVMEIPINGTVSNMPYEKSVLKYEQYGKYGLINLEGKQITKPIYEQIDSLANKESELLVKQNGKYGVINSKGAIIIKPLYDNIEADGFYTNEDNYGLSGYIISNKTQEGYRYGYINYKLKLLLNTEYNELYRIIEMDEKEDVYIIASKNGQVGLIKNNEVIINFDYQDIQYNEENLFVAQRDINYGVFDINGKTIIPVEYEEIDFNGLYIKALKEKQEIYFDLKGNEIENVKYSNILPTENDKYLVAINLDGQYGVLTDNQQILIENTYEYIEYLFDEYFIVAKDQGKLGIINSKNEIIVEFKYDTLQKIDDTKLIEAKILNENIIELYSKNMQSIAKIDAIKSTTYIFENYLQIYSPEEIKYFDLEGKELTSTQVFTQNKLFAKKENDKWGFVDKEGKKIVDFKYDAVTEFNKYGFAGVNINNKWGIIDELGNIVQEPIYDYIEYNSAPEFLGKYYKVYYGYGESYYTNKINN